MLSIFISSTSQDLKEHRKAVINALLNADTMPTAMEFFGARAGDAVEVSLDQVEKCDLFIGLYAHRYGYQPDGEKSITEMEYDHAVARGIDKLIFMVEPDYRAGALGEAAETDNDKKERLAAFKKRVNQNVRAEFTTPDDLATKVVSAVFAWYQSKQAQDEETLKQPAAPPPNTIENVNGDVRAIQGSTFGDNANITFGDNKKDK